MFICLLRPIEILGFIFTIKFLLTVSENIFTNKSPSCINNIFSNIQDAKLDVLVTGLFNHDAVSVTPSWNLQNANSSTRIYCKEISGNAIENFLSNLTGEEQIAVYQSHDVNVKLKAF